MLYLTQDHCDLTDSHKPYPVATPYPADAPKACFVTWADQEAHRQTLACDRGWGWGVFCFEM